MLSFVRALTSTLPQKLETLSHASTSQEEFIAETRSVRDTHLTLIRELGKSLLKIADECQAKEEEFARGSGSGGDGKEGKESKTYYRKAVDSFEHPEQFPLCVQKTLESSARVLGYTPGSGGAKLDSRVTYGIVPGRQGGGGGEM